MELLYWLQLHRSPFGEKLFSALTHMGSGQMVIVLLCILMWLFGRRIALRATIAFGGSALTNQLLKAICAVPRPWIRDARLIPVESAVPGATGYSFPSGHTQAATSLYASIALAFRRRWLSACCAASILGVMLSRMYLGVHTPLDVAVGCVLSLAITAILNRLVGRVESHPNYFRNVFICGAAISVGMAALALVSAALGVQIAGISDALPVAGGVLGFVSGIYIDSHKPEVLPSPRIGLLVCAAGLCAMGALRFALELALAPLLGADWLGFICYAALAFYASCIHPSALRALRRRLPTCCRIYKEQAAKQALQMRRQLKVRRDVLR